MREAATLRPTAHTWSERARTIVAFDADLAGATQNVLPGGIVPFPRGFASAEDGTLYLASGIGPEGEGAD
jgi:hypothetical protein